MESAITLPFFLLAILTVSLLIRLAATEENTMIIFADEGQKFAGEMYVSSLEIIPENYGAAEAFHEVLLESRTNRRIEREEKIRLKDVRVERDYIFDIYNDDPGKIRCSLLYNAEIPLPLVFNREPEFEQRLLFRGFIGALPKGKGIGFDEMEASGGLNSVFVFPRAGEKYHRDDCRIIDVYPVEKVLSRILKERYSPCRLCNAKELPYGCLVYCFDKSGKVYHKGSCTTVERYVVEMQMDEALEKGYTPCFYCGGYDE
ncbi:hypothetical protein MASR2M70_02680 [Bacillota bacterium]